MLPEGSAHWNTSEIHAWLEGRKGQEGGGGVGCRSVHSQMAQGPRNQLPVSPEREVEGESDQAQQGERKVPALW